MVVAVVAVGGPASQVTVVVPVAVVRVLVVLGQPLLPKVLNQETAQVMVFLAEIASTVHPVAQSGEVEEEVPVPEARMDQKLFLQMTEPATAEPEEPTA